VVLADVVAVVAAVVVVVVVVCCCLASPSFFLPVMVVPCRRRFSCRWRGGGKEQGRWRLSPSRCMSYCTINVVRKKKKKKSERKTYKGLERHRPLKPRPSRPSLCVPFPALVVDLIAASWWPRFTCSEGLGCGRWATCVGGGIWCCVGVNAGVHVGFRWHLMCLVSSCRPVETRKYQHKKKKRERKTY
jgi:hypothetical protein